MRSFKFIGFITGTLLIVFSCGTSKQKENQTKVNDEQEKVFPVKVEQIQLQKISKTLNYTADLEAFKEIHYAPSSPGRITKIFVEVGSRVIKGQVLVEMDKTQLNQAQTQFENAKSNFLRIDTLYQLGSISEQQYEQAKTQYELAKSNVEYLAENTSLVSPINGIVTGKYFEGGELYSGSPNTGVGKAAIISLMQINPLKAIVSISQTYFPSVKKGMNADIQTEIYPGVTFLGIVNKVYPTIDPGTRTFKTEIIVENETELLRPGMFANIEIELHKEDAIVVPAISVLKQEGTNNRYIFINDNKIAKKVEIIIGKRFDDKLEIISDEIHVGDELVIKGQSNLLNGSAINTVGE